MESANHWFHYQTPSKEITIGESNEQPYQNLSNLSLRSRSERKST